MKQKKWATLFGMIVVALILAACDGDSGNNSSESEGNSSSSIDFSSSSGQISSSSGLSSSSVQESSSSTDLSSSSVSLSSSSVSDLCDFSIDEDVWEFTKGSTKYSYVIDENDTLTVSINDKVKYTYDVSTASSRQIRYDAAVSTCKM